MANTFLGEFDSLDSAALAYEYALAGGANVPTVVSGWLRLADNAASQAVRSIPSAVTYTIGFRMRFSSMLVGSVYFIWACGDATRTHVGLRLNTDGTLSAMRSGVAAPSMLMTAALLATGSAVLVADTEYYIEIQVTISNTNGVVQVRINGDPTPDIDVDAGDGADTQNAGTAAITWFGFNGNAAPTQLEVTDLYANNTTGADCAGFLGDVQVDYHVPTTDSVTHADWTPSAGGDHFATIDEVPPSEADYNSEAALNGIDTFEVEAFKNDGADIFAIQTTMLVAKSDAGVCAVAAVLRESGSDTVGTSRYPSTAYAVVVENYSLAAADPKRAAAGFDAAEYGIKKVA